MDIKQLRALVTIAETGNVTRASALLNLVQPAVSRQLKLLEEEVGTSLFERGRHGMELTESGRILVEYARRILTEVARARAEIKPVAEEVSGLVTIGLLASTTELLASDLVGELAANYPGIRIRVTVGYAGHLQRWIEAGEVDAGLLYDVRQSASIQVKPLLSEALWVIGPASAKLAPNRPVTMKQFAKGKVVLPSAPHGLRTLIEEAAGAAGVSLQVAAETNELSLQKQLVTDGLGLTIFPAIAAATDLREGRLSGAPLKNPEVRRKIVLGTASTRPPNTAVRRVMEVLMGVMRRAVDASRWPTAKWLG